MFGKNKKKDKEKKDFFGEQWKEEELIGEGSYGKVYKAKKEEFGITTYSAIKQIEIPQSKAEVQTLKTEGMTSSDITNYYEKSVQKWVDEIKFMSIFRDSENVVNIEDYEILKKKDTIGWIINIRMELLTNLDSYILENNVTDKEILKMAIDVSNALIDCEENEVIHRDIKPDNIFINKKGVYKVGDFGIAKKIEKTVSNMSKKGTENYMAPELYKNERGNRTVDIYSLGIMLYRYFNYNRLPFLPDYPNEITIDSREEALYKRISGEKMKAPQNASREISEIILKACSYYPKDRYSSAVELKADLEKVYEKIEKPIVLFDFDAKKMNKIFLENTKSETHDSTINILTGMQENSKTGEVKIVDLPPEAVGATAVSSGAEQAVEGATEKVVEVAATSAVTTGAIAAGATIEVAEEVASTASDVALSGADVAGDIHNKTRNMFDGKKELNEESEIKELNIENEVGNAESKEIEEENELEGSKESKEADAENDLEKDIKDTESEAEKREEEQQEKEQEQEGDKEENSENKIKSQFGIKLKSYRKKIIIIILLLLIIIAIALLMIYKPWEPEVVEEEKVSVPSVIGMTSSEAIIALGDAGLEIEYEYVETDNEDEVGLVIDQSIGESEEVSKGTVIKLTIAVSKEKVSVISVVGLTMEEAVNKLEELGLKVSITEQYNDEVEAEIVISQMTAEGEEVSKGTVIELLVSMGPESTESEETTTNTSSTAKNTASTSTSSTGTSSTGTTSSSSDTSSSGTSGSSGSSSSSTSDSSSSSSSTSSSSSSTTTTTTTYEVNVSSTEIFVTVGHSAPLSATITPENSDYKITGFSSITYRCITFTVSGSSSVLINAKKRGTDLVLATALNSTTGDYIESDWINIYVVEDGAGDLDGDGDVDAIDTALAMDFYKYGGATDADLLVGDIDYDGDIDSIDAALIMDMYKFGVY